MARTKIPFLEVFSDETKNGTKLKTCEYLISGIHPIIDQGQDFIAGYTNAEDGLYTNVPVIIFGDHTRVLKYVDFPFFLGADGAKILKPLSTQANYKYLYYALKCVRIPDTGYNRHFKWLKEAKITIPDIQKQTDIVATLDAVARILTLRRAQLAKLDELVKCRFIELFGDPANNSKNWVTKPLRDCLSSIDGGKSFVCLPSARTRDWPAILKLSAITSGFYLPNENKAVIDNEHFSPAAEVKAGDLLFTRKNTPELVGISAYVYHSPVKLMIPDLIFRLNTNDNCNKIFLWKLINHELFRSSISAIATGSAKSMSNISQERLLKLHIICPPVEQQTAFADFVRRVDKSRFAIQASLDKTQQLFDSLMQEYFG